MDHTSLFARLAMATESRRLSLVSDHAAVPPVAPGKLVWLDEQGCRRVEETRGTKCAFTAGRSTWVVPPISSYVALVRSPATNRAMTERLRTRMLPLLTGTCGGGAS